MNILAVPECQAQREGKCLICVACSVCLGMYANHQTCYVWYTVPSISYGEIIIMYLPHIRQELVQSENVLQAFIRYE